MRGGAVWMTQNHSALDKVRHSPSKTLSAHLGHRCPQPSLGSFGDCLLQSECVVCGPGMASFEGLTKDAPWVSSLWGGWGLRRLESGRVGSQAPLPQCPCPHL